MNLITISAEEISISAELNESPTAEEIWKALPIEGTVNTWGDEIYFEIPVIINEEPDARAAVSHGWGICSDVEPESTLEKILYAIDELTGLITANAMVRPSKSVMDMSVKSVKKKWKSPAFAAGVNRSIIQKGADMLEVELGELIEDTIMGMREVADEIGLKGNPDQKAS